MNNKIFKLVLLILIVFVIVAIPQSVFARGEAGATIVIDPGHGGKDGGTSHNGVNEREVNLKIARYLKSYLEEYKNVKVILTHNGNIAKDATMSNEDRSEVARKNKADLFISIHNNNIESPVTNGAEAFVTYRTELDKYNKDMTLLANKILANISRLGISNRGVKTRLVKNENNDPRYMYYDNTKSDYYGVIRWCMRGGYTEGLGPNFSDGSGIPAVLVEHAFMSNEQDFQFLNNDVNLQKLAKADCNAIVDFYGLVNKNATSSKVNGYLKNGGIDITFDANYYADRNADVKRAYGNNVDKLYAHWLAFGIKEGRVASRIFDVNYYLANNKDLNNAFHGNKVLAREHFLRIGCTENRITSDEFHVMVYKNNYADLRKAFGNDLKKYYEHYARCGDVEGRITRYDIKVVKLLFDAKYYADNNYDLKNAFGYNQNDLLTHYVMFGVNENRQATANSMFDINVYAEKNSDVKKAFKNNKTLMLKHFFNCGVNENRVTSNYFNVINYKDNYADLQKAFGNNWKLYFIHYYEFGQKEGREAVKNLREEEEKKQFNPAPLIEEEFKDDEKTNPAASGFNNIVDNNVVNTVDDQNNNIVNNTNVNNVVNNSVNNEVTNTTNSVSNTTEDEIIIDNNVVNNVVNNSIQNTMNVVNNSVPNLVGNNVQDNEISNTIIEEIIP